MAVEQIETRPAGSTSWQSPASHKSNPCHSEKNKQATRHKIRLTQLAQLLGDLQLLLGGEGGAGAAQQAQQTQQAALSTAGASGAAGNVWLAAAAVRPAALAASASKAMGWDERSAGRQQPMAA